MRKWVFAAAIVASGSLPAAAQSWTGTYGGVSGGYGAGHSNQTDPGPVNLPAASLIPLDGHYSAKGGLLGGTLGYDLQKGPWVFGLEGDLSWAHVSGQSAVCAPTSATPHSCGTRLDALGTFRGRVGYATGPTGNWLIYATGGLATGKVYGWDSLTPSSGSDWRGGWTVGGGIETALAWNWSAKLEYLYANLGNAQTFNSMPGVPESVSLTANIVRLGFNYRFGGPDTATASRMYTKALPTKAPVMALGPWSGWYAGVNAGYLDGSRTINTNAAVISASSTPATAPAMAAGATRQLSTGNGGFLGGGQFGYNKMVSPTILAGFEADLQGASLRGSASSTSTVPIAGTGFSFVTPITTSRSLDYLGTIRGRIGATLTPATLLYVTGGLAYGGVKSSTTIGQRAPGSTAPIMGTVGSFSDLRAGYTVGGGAEWMFASNWSVKAEYLYYDLGSANYGTGGFGFDQGPTNFPGIGVAGIATTTHVRFNGDIVRLGINYHLN